jgi:phosphoglycerate dehydrogenase-like enzyme
MRERLVVSAGKDLFESFFTPHHKARLTRIFDWERHHTPSAVRLDRELASADALITTWDSPRFDDRLPDIAPKLRIIAHCGGEVKARFARTLFDKLTITNAAGPMASATAELGAAFLLYYTRNIDHYRAELRKSSNRIYDYVHTYGTPESIVGREVAMIGFGRIARALVDLLRGFQLCWTVYDPFAPRSMAKNYPVTFSELKPLLRRAELLVLTAALTNRTRGMLNRKSLALLPDGAAIINIARGGLIDLAALTSEVRRKRLRCALDVSDPAEPLPINHPLRKLPGAIVTPHIAGGGLHVRHAIADTVIDNLENFFKGRRVQNRVSRSMLDRMT